MVSEFKLQPFERISNKLENISFNVVNFNVPENVKWIKVNAHQTGYYRVLYNDDNWANIIEDLLNNPDKFASEVSSIRFYCN